MALDLATTVEAPPILLESPSLYSTASDSSLHISPLNLGGPWRMFVPDVGSALDELDMDDMIVDTPFLLNSEVAIVNADLAPAHNDKAIVVHDSVNADKHSNQVASQFKAAALLQLNIINEDGSTMAEDGGGRGLVMGQDRFDDATGQLIPSNDSVGKQPQREIETEVEKIVYKVQKAMEKLPHTEGNKKVRRDIESTSTQVRSLVNSMKEEDKVIGVLMKDDEAVVFVSSETSGESGDKKRKRKVTGASNAGTVSSRIRKKGAGSDTKMQGAVRKVKMAVRKCKVPAKKPNTSLTLAPPAMGLPTP